MWTMSSHSQPIGTVWGSRFNTHESFTVCCPHCIANILTWFTNSPSTWTCVGLHILSQLVHQLFHQLQFHLLVMLDSIFSRSSWTFRLRVVVCAPPKPQLKRTRRWHEHAHSAQHTAHCTEHAQRTAHRACTQRTAEHTTHITKHTAHRTQRTQHIAQALPAGAWQRFELRNTFRKYVHTHIVIAHKHKDTSNYKQNCVCKRYKSTSASWMLYIKNTWKGPKLRVKFAPKLS